jgi:cytochrome c
MRVTSNLTTAFLLGGALCAAPARAALSYPNCSDLVPADFGVEILNSQATDKATIEPMKLAFDMDASGNVSVYFTQRMGLLRKYDPVKKATVDIADFSKYPNFTTKFSGGSDGLLGVAVDPAFKTNHWIYLYISTNVDWRVSRFTLSGDVLDMATEKTLIKIPMTPLSPHPGGALAFDKNGYLWITTGEDGKGMPAATTNNLIGKILRIKPTAEGSYTSPEDNLFKASDKTRPEIYIMGNRNPYTISIDEGRNAVTWGEVGPDQGLITEEHNIATKPGFHGWPMYSGANISHGKGAGTPEKPINNDPANTGLSELPPAIPGFDNYKQSCSLTGPVYYYNPANPSQVKFPPHLNGMWFVGDFSRGTFEALQLDAGATKILARTPMFTDMKFDRPLDLQVGPDGAFYMVNYAGYRDFTSKTGILKISYKGNCRPTTANALPKPAWVDHNVQIEGMDLKIMSAGPHKVEIKDLAGRLLDSRNGEGLATYSLAKTRNAGLCVVTVSTQQGNFAMKVIR